ncbi:hypothetical protein JCM33374_g1831 [Metschnikowia sp. JCM 33374]|nr:hypothetical protein JCM33374_g1831 [Metschnikowia sp. JCM 33374]
MQVSPEFLRSEIPTGFQSLLLAVLAVFVPPLPIYLLSGPKNTIKTKEFLICCLLTLIVFIFGTLYAVYFIFVTFPAARREAGSEGLLRVGDLETQSGHRHEISHQSGDIQHREINHPVSHGAVSVTNHSPYSEAQGKNIDPRESLSEPLLPTYEESEGASNGEVRNDITKLGDNKVQH